MLKHHQQSTALGIVTWSRSGTKRQIHHHTFCPAKIVYFTRAGTPFWNWIVQSSIRCKLTNLQLTICFEALLPPRIGMEFLWLWASLLTLCSAACPATFPRVCHSGYQNRRSNLPSTLCRLVPTHSPGMHQTWVTTRTKNMSRSLCICVISTIPSTDLYKCIPNPTWLHTSNVIRCNNYPMESMESSNTISWNIFCWLFFRSSEGSIQHVLLKQYLGKGDSHKIIEPPNHHLSGKIRMVSPWDAGMPYTPNTQETVNL